MGSLWGEPTGQGWVQIFELAVALVLSAVIGLERELQQKSAGLRTHTLIGFSSALIMLVSKYGFTDVLGEHVLLDPSRVAAQIVSGIGFIGGGLIFVKRDMVRGLTTAAAVWLTTAVGMAAGAGLPVLAAATTVGYLAVVYGFPPLTAWLRRSRPRSQVIEVTYQDGRGLLRRVLNTCTAQGWVVAHLSTRHYSGYGADRGAPNLSRRDADTDSSEREWDSVSVMIELRGAGSFENLAAGLTELDGVRTVSAGNPDDIDPEAE
ncbi:MAG TPA: MgtC/SapB family protein [Pseudonocardia sp.]|jgi:putative Mg2+ transporter-C (MgtC) family protein